MLFILSFLMLVMSSAQANTPPKVLVEMNLNQEKHAVLTASPGIIFYKLVIEDQQPLTGKIMTLNGEHHVLIRPYPEVGYQQQATSSKQKARLKADDFQV